MNHWHQAQRKHAFINTARHRSAERIFIVKQTQSEQTECVYNEPGAIIIRGTIIIEVQSL